MVAQVNGGGLGGGLPYNKGRGRVIGLVIVVNHARSGNKAGIIALICKVGKRLLCRGILFGRNGRSRYLYIGNRALLNGGVSVFFLEAVDVRIDIEPASVRAVNGGYNAVFVFIVAPDKIDTPFLCLGDRHSEIVELVLSENTLGIDACDVLCDDLEAVEVVADGGDGKVVVLQQGIVKVIAAGSAHFLGLKVLVVHGQLTGQQVFFLLKAVVAVGGKVGMVFVVLHDGGHHGDLGVVQRGVNGIPSAASSGSTVGDLHIVPHMVDGQLAVILVNALNQDAVYAQLVHDCLESA